MGTHAIPTIGIDVGHSAIKAAVPNRLGEPQVIKSPRGGTSIPSVVYRKQDGTHLVGEDAREAAFADPNNAAQSFKLDLGTDKPLLGGLTARALVAIQLKAVVEAVEEQCGIVPVAAVLTVPIWFNDVRTKDLIAAANEAGLEVKSVVTEPAAAAYAYFSLKGVAHHGKKIAVFDLGSGTLDIAFCQGEGSHLNVLASDGVANIAGAAYRAILHDLVLSKLGARVSVDPNQLLQDGILASDIEDRCRQAIITLGNQDIARIPLSFAGDHHVIEITKAEFEVAIESLVKQGLDCFDRALAAAKISTGELTSIYLVGGPCRMPFITKCVEAHTRLIARKEIDPEHAVAIGASLIARDLDVNSDRTLPSVNEVVRHALGVAVEVQGSQGVQLVNSIIVPKNTRVPCVKHLPYRLVDPDQRIAIVEILAGEENAPREQCLVIGSLELTDLPVEQALSHRIIVTFSVDKSGLAAVTARDQISGKEVSCSVQIPK